MKEFAPGGMGISLYSFFQFSLKAQRSLYNQSNLFSFLFLRLHSPSTIFYHDNLLFFKTYIFYNKFMLYLFIDKNRVKVLYLKKSLLGQYETRVFSKTYQSSNFLEQGKLVNVDFVASAVKEALQSLSNGEVKDRDTLLILPQESYSFLRIGIPSDIAATAIASFVKDKAR